MSKTPLHAHLKSASESNSEQVCDMRDHRAWCSAVIMWRALGFFVATAVFVGGVNFFWFEVTETASFHGWMMMASVLVAVAGGAWLWADYVGPAMAGRRPNA